MLPKKVRRERSLSFPISGEPSSSEAQSAATASGRQSSQSASATSKTTSFFDSSAGDSTASSSVARFDTRTTVALLRNATHQPSLASSSTSWPEDRGLVSPRVFNFYDLPSFSEQKQAQSGSRQSPILLVEDPDPNEALRAGMSTQRLDTSGNKLTPHFICNVCNKVCGSQAQLILHQHSHKFSCPICPDIFTKRALLQTHMLQHCPNSEHYVCSIESCNRRFTTAALLQKHIEYEHLMTSQSTVSFDSPSRQQRRTMSESSDWSPIGPQHSPSSPTSFRTPTSSTWNQPTDSSPAPSSDLFRSPSGSISSPLCRRNIGSEGGSFKPYNRSPISTISGIDWNRANKALIQGIRDNSSASHIAQLLLMQQTSEALASSTGSGSKFFDQQQSLQAAFLSYSKSDQSSSLQQQQQGAILTPLPFKQGLSVLKRQHTLSESAIDSERKASRSEETMTPEPSPNLTKPVTTSSPMGSLDRLYLDCDTSSMGGLELLGQVSSQLSKLREGDSVKNKTKPAPLDLSSESQLTLTPPHTSTPRYLWTPTKAAVGGSAFFCQDPRKIRIGSDYQATIPDFISTKPDTSEDNTGLARPLYVPAEKTEEEGRREQWFGEMASVYPDTEFLHHCVHRTGGDLGEAAKLARSPFGPLVPNDHPCYKYRYTSRWSQEDQERFFLLFQKFGKDLPSIARCLPSRSLSEVVEYYYVWKVRYPELYRQWRRPPPVSQQQQHQQASTAVLGADFDMRAAPKPSRGRGRKEIVYFETEAYTTHDAKGNKEIKFRQKKVVTPYSSSPRPRSNKPPNPQPLGSYKCKICGKEFQKVKSRSAHMKTHKRQQNAVSGLLSAGPSLLQQQYQQLHSQQQQLHHQLQQQLKQAVMHPELARDVIMAGSRDLGDVTMVGRDQGSGGDHGVSHEEVLARAARQQQQREQSDVVMSEQRTDTSSEVVTSRGGVMTAHDITMTTGSSADNAGR